MKGITGFVTVVALGFTLATALAKDTTPSATIKLSGGSVAAGVGVDWGRGTLTYQGKEYPISVKGVSLGDVGFMELTDQATFAVGSDAGNGALSIRLSGAVDPPARASVRGADRA